jgi:hypothetical protein
MPLRAAGWAVLVSVELASTLVSVEVASTQPHGEVAAGTVAGAEVVGGDRLSPLVLV